MTSKKEVKKINKKIVEDKKIKPLMQQEALFFKELVETNNKYTGMLKQKAQFEFAITQLQKHRKDIQTGEIKMPMLMTLIPNLVFYYEHSKKKIAYKLRDRDGMPIEDVIEYIDHNITGAYVGERTPIMLEDLILEMENINN